MELLEYRDDLGHKLFGHDQIALVGLTVETDVVDGDTPSRSGPTGQPGRQLAPRSAAVTVYTVAAAGAVGWPGVVGWLGDGDVAGNHGGAVAAGGGAGAHCGSTAPAAITATTTATVLFIPFQCGALVFPSNREDFPMLRPAGLHSPPLAPATWAVYPAICMNEPYRFRRAWRCGRRAAQFRT